MTAKAMRGILIMWQVTAGMLSMQLYWHTNSMLYIVLAVCALIALVFNTVALFLPEDE